MRTAAKISVSEIKRRFAERDEEAERLTVEQDELPMVAETVVPFGADGSSAEAAPSESDAFEASLFGSDPEAPTDEETDSVTVAEAAEAYLRAVLAEDYGSAYTYLHPGQQTLIGRDLFMHFCQVAGRYYQAVAIEFNT